MAGGFARLCIFVVFLVVCIDLGYCADVFCYDCNSKDDSYCEDPFTASDAIVKNCTKVDPKFKDGGCRKLIQDIDTDAAGTDKRIIRECASKIEKNEDYERTGTYKVKILYYPCKGDRCNSASSVTASLCGILGLFIAMFTIKA